MNKEVSVEGMQMKAHAEEGLLINEVKAVDSTTWDELAIAGDDDYTALRPASTMNLTDWWHANSLKSNSEAGYGADGVDANTVEIEDGVYYTDIKPGATDVETELTNEDGAEGVAAEKAVYYKDAAYGTDDQYDNGEGYYILYKYYIKSSSDTGYTVPAGNFQIKVTATKENEGDSDSLDAALRVGVKVVDGTNDDYIIFAPITGADASYNVAGSTAGATYTPVGGSGSTINYVTGQAFASLSEDNDLDIPAVSDEGMEIDVYVWFEGEDSNCKSDNLTATLGEYQIDLDFKDATL